MNIHIINFFYFRPTVAFPKNNLSLSTSSRDLRVPLRLQFGNLVRLFQEDVTMDTKINMESYQCLVDKIQRRECPLRPRQDGSKNKRKAHLVVTCQRAKYSSA